MALIIASGQRHGTNYIMTLIGKLNEFDVLGEMFHNGGPYFIASDDSMFWRRRFELLACVLMNSLHALCQDERDLLKSYIQTLDKDKMLTFLSSFSHRKPDLYKSALHFLCRNLEPAIKIFPEHIHGATSLSGYISPNDKVLFLYRDPLDAYISFKKLELTKQPQNYNTSSVQIQFVEDEFEAYYKGMKKYYKTVRFTCQSMKIDFTEVFYEDLTSLPGEGALMILKEQLSSLYEIENLVMMKENSLPEYKRQDFSSRPDKVLNPKELLDLSYEYPYEFIDKD